VLEDREFESFKQEDKRGSGKDYEPGLLASLGPNSIAVDDDEIKIE